MSRFSQQKGIKSPDYQHCKGAGERGWGELALCPNVFIWNCLKEEFKECHTTRSNKAWRRGELYPRDGSTPPFLQLVLQRVV